MNTKQFNIWEFLNRNVYFKLILFIFAIIGVFFAFYFGTKNNYSQDIPLELKIMDVESRKKFGRFAATVNVGMIVKNFISIDVIKNNFLVDLTIWFDFFADEVMLETIGQFSFDNGDIIKKSSPDIRIKDNLTSVKYDVRLAFKSNMMYSNFPIENHKISIILTNNFVTPAELFFTTEDSRLSIDPSISIPDWNVLKDSTMAGYLELISDPKSSKKDVFASVSPKVRFTMNLTRKGAKDAFVIFVPMYLVAFIGTYSFLTSVTNAAWRYLMASAPLPALLGYRFVIQNMLPQVSYFTIADSIYLFLLIYNFAIFIFQTIFQRKIYALTKKETKNVNFKIYEIINTACFLINLFAIVFGSWWLI